MKIETSVLERALIANLLRRQAMGAIKNARATKSDRQRRELDDEANLAEALAIRFDEGEPLVMTEPTPIISNDRVDLDYLDNTGGKKN